MRGSISSRLPWLFAFLGFAATFHAQSPLPSRYQPSGGYSLVSTQSTELVDRIIR